MVVSKSQNNGQDSSASVLLMLEGYRQDKLLKYACFTGPFGDAVFLLPIVVVSHWTGISVSVAYKYC